MQPRIGSQAKQKESSWIVRHISHLPVRGLFLSMESGLQSGTQKLISRAASENRNSSVPGER